MLELDLKATTLEAIRVSTEFANGLRDVVATLTTPPRVHWRKFFKVWRKLLDNSVAAVQP